MGLRRVEGDELVDLGLSDGKLFCRVQGKKSSPRYIVRPRIVRLGCVGERCRELCRSRERRLVQVFLHAVAAPALRTWRLTIRIAAGRRRGKIRAGREARMGRDDLESFARGFYKGLLVFVEACDKALFAVGHGLFGWERKLRRIEESGV
eukprot:1322079-Amorphochlora_amoeboformis.AAC.1